MIYHGCSKRNIDGTNRLINKGEVCSKPTKKSFWMEPQDGSNRVKIRLQKENQKDVRKKDFEEYFRKKYVEKWLKKSFDSEEK